MAKAKPLTNTRILMGADLPPTNFKRIPTGWYLLDSLMLEGGIRTGITAEVVSQEGGGKTLLCMRVAANAQQMGLRVAWGDPEYYVKPGVQSWFERQGVDFKALQLFGHAEDGKYVAGESVISDALGFLRASEKNPYAKDFWADVVVIDSIAALKPGAYVEALAKGEDLAEINTKYPGLQARMLGAGTAAMAEASVQENKLVLVCNQARDSFGKRAGWLDDEHKWIPFGGHEYRHRLDMRLILKFAGMIKEGTEKVGQLSRVEVQKNRVGQNYQSTGGVIPHLPIYYDGRDYGSRDEVVDAAAALGIITQKGSWFEFGPHRAQGKAALTATLKEHGMMDALDRMVIARATSIPPEKSSAEDEEAEQFDLDSFWNASVEPAPAPVEDYGESVL